MIFDKFCDTTDVFYVEVMRQQHDLRAVHANEFLSFAQNLRIESALNYCAFLPGCSFYLFNASKSIFHGCIFGKSDRTWHTTVKFSEGHQSETFTKGSGMNLER